MFISIRVRAMDLPSSTLEGQKLLRRMVDLTFQLLREATVFPKLDLRNVCHLVRIRAVDEWKTAFNISLGHFEYLVMPATFQALVNVVLRDIILFVYLDNITVIFRELGRACPAL